MTDNREIYKSQGYNPLLFRTPVKTMLSIVFITAFIPYISVLFWIFIGLRNVFRTRTYFFQYKSFYRYQSNLNVSFKISPFLRIESENYAKATKNERIIYIAKGLYCFLLAWVMVYYSEWVVSVINSKKEKINLEIVDNERGITTYHYGTYYLKTEPKLRSQNIENMVFHDDTLTILETRKTEKDTIWYLVKKDEKTQGWIYNIIPPEKTKK